MIFVGEDVFDAGALIEDMRQRDTSCGALVTFIGSVRDINEGEDVSALTLEHYPGMTEKVLCGIADKAQQRFGVNQIDIYHRVGTLGLNEQIVFVGVAAKHRESAFLACEFVMDFLKTEAPFWKKEHRKSETVWLDQAKKEALARKRWE
ncbi:molybdenum cofactor biosynthesis protein MoaE [Vibrio sp.]|nr:molybdenum cofactor biosynthesis protein MoaE [Vibrio viridaestus]MDC0611448.1 molybdenum cofactor biosynthesis protein MoaE [Vibrio sp.]